MGFKAGDKRLGKKKMIIIRLKGGLGNQMFQYAMGRALAEKLKINFKLDVKTGFENDLYKRKYRLNHFNIIENIAREDELRKVKLYQEKSLLGKVYRRIVDILPIYQRYYIIERKYKNNPKLLSKNVSKYLDGYWQSEKYFKHVEPILRKEFTMKKELEGKGKLLMKQIIKVNSIAIHIRKLHGVSAEGQIDEKAKKIYINLSRNYYSEGIKFISSMKSNPHFYVFSDNPNWNKNNIKISFPFTIVSGLEDYEDLILISKCKHQIIANSTFSWWAAWLNSNPSKIVIAPQKWVIDDNDYHAKIPQSWLRFKNTGN